MMLCVEWKTPYVGICLTNSHRDSLKRQLTKMVFAAFSDPRSPLHNPVVRTLMSGSKAQAITSDGRRVQEQQLDEHDGDDGGMNLPEARSTPKPTGGEPGGKRPKRGTSSLRQSILENVFEASADASGGVKQEPNIGDD